VEVVLVDVDVEVVLVDVDVEVVLVDVDVEVVVDDVVDDCGAAVERITPDSPTSKQVAAGQATDRRPLVVPVPAAAQVAPPSPVAISVPAEPVATHTPLGKHVTDSRSSATGCWAAHV